RTACDLADCPNARRGCLQSIVDLDESLVGQFNPGQLQPEPFCIRSAACRDEQMAALKDLFDPTLLDDDLYRIPRLSGDSLDLRVQNSIDALILQQAVKSLQYIFVFPMHYTIVAINHRHVTAESAHRLRQFYSDIAATNHQ